LGYSKAATKTKEKILGVVNVRNVCRYL